MGFRIDYRGVSLFAEYCEKSGHLVGRVKVRSCSHYVRFEESECGTFEYCFYMGKYYEGSNVRDAFEAMVYSRNL